MSNVTKLRPDPVIVKIDPDSPFSLIKMRDAGIALRTSESQLVIFECDYITGEGIPATGRWELRGNNFHISLEEHS